MLLVRPQAHELVFQLVTEHESIEGCGVVAGLVLSSQAQPRQVLRIPGTKGCVIVTFGIFFRIRCVARLPGAIGSLLDVTKWALGLGSEHVHLMRSWQKTKNAVRGIHDA